MSNRTRVNSVSEPVHNLRKIREILPDAIIAGGYYRDLYHNIPYSDVDIFINTNNYNLSPGGHKIPWTERDFYDSDFWEYLLCLNDDDYIDNVTSEEEYDEDNIVSVFELCIKSIKYNIILLDNYDPIEYVNEQFDFDICKVYGDGTKVSLSKEFMRDSKHKTITFTEKDVTFEFFCHSMGGHLKKLKQKFKGFTVQVPDKHFMYLAKSKITI